MRDLDGIVISTGDEVTITKNDDGANCIRIQNSAWVEEPRFIEFAVVGKHDRERAINQLIWALQEVRDAKL